ncbi:hypothetical protein J6590_079214 [Homalodisca vitripennis]|nr:hypothetical protein J6590_079214 [Homalodisca vitripennis]
MKEAKLRVVRKRQRAIIPSPTVQVKKTVSVPEVVYWLPLDLSSRCRLLIKVSLIPETRFIFNIIAHMSHVHNSG